MKSGQADFRAIARRAANCPHGWIYEGVDGHGHHVVSLDGRKIAWPGTSSDVNGARNFASALEAVCGCKFWERGGSKPSRKRSQMSGFNPAKAAQEAALWAATHPNRYTLRDRYRKALSDLRDCDPRREQTRMRRLAQLVVDLERQLDETRMGKGLSA